MVGGLSDNDWIAICNVMARFPQVERRLLFGSRAIGNYTTGSDVDLALVGKSINEVITQIGGALNNDLPIPYKFDVVDYQALENKNLKLHIDRVGINIYPT